MAVGILKKTLSSVCDFNSNLISENEGECYLVCYEQKMFGNGLYIIFDDS